MSRLSHADADVFPMTTKDIHESIIAHEGGCNKLRLSDRLNGVTARRHMTTAVINTNAILVNFLPPLSSA